MGISPLDSDLPNLAAVLAIGLEQHELSRANAYSLLSEQTTDPEFEEGDEYPEIVGYEITGRLGEGGMGVVWRAVQLATRRPVALKLMSGGMLGSPKARHRFEREVELAARLEHPNVARVYDSGICRGQCYYAMELIDGLTIDQYASERKLNQAQVLELFCAVCQAIEHAHQRGVIHRDLKPSNVLITSDGQPHVVDFGLAKAVSGTEQLHVTVDGHFAGTPAFMSPEQAAGNWQRVDTRSDVYALGATLYLLLVGRTPHELSGPRQQTLRRIIEDEVRRPRQLNPALDSEIDAILLKALSHEPGRRYASVTDLLRDLQSYLGGRPVQACPPSLQYLACKWVRRRRLPLTMTASVAAMMVGLAIASYVRVARARSDAVWAQNREAQARQIAEQRRLTAEAARHDAIQNAVRADQMRRTAELRLAEGLVAQGDAMAQGGRWVEAKDLYREAGADFEKMDLSRMPADLGLLNAYRVAPPPLLELRGHRGPVLQTAFSRDGKLAASAGTDGTVYVWDLLRGRMVHRLAGHSQEVTCVAFSPDQRRLISGSKDRTVRLWDLATATCLRQLPFGTEPHSVAFSPSGKWCTVGTDSDQSLMWEVATGREVCRHGLKNGDVWMSTFSGDERTCLVCGRHDHMELQDAATGRMLRSIHTGIVTYAAAYSRDGKLLLTGHGAEGGGDCTTLLWDTQSWQVIRQFPGHTDAVTSVAFSPDQTRVLAASDDGTVMTWAISGGPPLKVVCGDGQPLRNISISGDCQSALTGDEDGVVRLWDLGGDQGMEALLTPDGTLSVATTSDGRLAATAGPDGICVFDVPARRQLYHIPSQRPRGLVAMSSDGRHALSSDDWGGVHLLDAAAATEKSLPQAPRITRDADFSRDGKLVAWGDGAEAFVADLRTLTIRTTVRPYMTMAESLAFSSDANLLLSATSHGTAYMWLLPWGIQVPTLAWFQEHRGLNTNVVYFNHLGSMAGGSAKRLLVWDTFSGRLLGALDGHRGWISRIALSPDERWVASSAWDGMVKLWDLRQLREARTLDGHGGAAVRSLCWSANGNVLLSGANDRRVCVWDLTRPEQYRRFADELASAQSILGQDSSNPAALATLGRWYVFRGHDDRAVQLFHEAAARGAQISPLMLARSLWRLGRYVEALKAFNETLQRATAPQEKFYLTLCRDAVREIEAEPRRQSAAQPRPVEPARYPHAVVSQSLAAPSKPFP